jgi:hypothetical protein
MVQGQAGRFGVGLPMMVERAFDMFTLDDDSREVVGIAHAKRRPRYWLDRK